METRAEHIGGWLFFLLLLAAVGLWLMGGAKAEAAGKGTLEQFGAGVGTLLEEGTAPKKEAESHTESADAEEESSGRKTAEQAAHVAVGGDASIAADAEGTAETETAETDGTDTEGTEEAAAEADAGETADETDEEEPDTKLVMANVQNVLNVRREPDEEAEKAGYLYADCGGEILEQKDGWTKLKSGKLTGWAKDDYLIFGEEALELAEKTGRTEATVRTTSLRVRREPDPEAKVIDLAAEGAVYDVVSAKELEFSDGIEISEDWVAVDFGGETGFVSAEYVDVSFEVAPGESVEEIQAREEAEKQAEEAKKAEAKEKEKKKKKTDDAKSSAGDSTAGKEKQNLGAIPADVSDVTLLAALIHSEAGNQSYEGQLAVGAVVMNRVRSGAYPNTIRDVILASGQFTPVSSGQVANRIATGDIKASCIQAAQEAISGVSNVGTATRFRRAGSREGIVIGNHVFW